MSCDNPKSLCLPLFIIELGVGIGTYVTNAKCLTKLIYGSEIVGSYVDSTSFICADL